MLIAETILLCISVIVHSCSVFSVQCGPIDICKKVKLSSHCTLASIIEQRFHSHASAGYQLDQSGLELFEFEQSPAWPGEKLSDVNIIELGSALVSFVPELHRRLLPLQQLLGLAVEGLQLDGGALVESDVAVVDGHHRPAPHRVLGVVPVLQVQSSPLSLVEVQ